VSRPRLLVLSAYPPSSEAPHGGSRVAARLVGGLAERNRVALVCLRGREDPAVDAALAERCETVTTVERPHVEGRARRLAGLARARPSWVVEWSVPALRERLATLVESWRPDLVHVHYQAMGQYLPALEAPRVLVVYEPATGRAATAAAETPLGPRRVLRHADYLAWRRYERRLVRAVQAVTVFTERDRDEIAGLGAPTPIAVIPFGVDAPPQPLDPLGSGQDVVLFLGNFAHAPNVDAALRLGSTVFPRIRAARPQARLELVGPEPPPELAALANAHVSVTGAVPDVEPHLDRASVFVAPIRAGGGMRVKVLEALAAGKAVVASRLAAEGLDVRDGDQLVLAETDEEFVAAIALLLDDPERRRALAERARRFALESLGWERTFAAYERLHASLLSTAAAERDHQRVAREPAGAEPAARPAAVPPAPQDTEEPGDT
jgi:glycosyltransferase involved in cell wall biosynthesis